MLLRNNPRDLYSEPIVQALAAQGLAAELPVNPFAVLGEDYPRMLVCIMRLLRDREDGLAWREAPQAAPEQHRGRLADGGLPAR